MDADFPKERTPFIFSDPAGRRWPRLRLALLLGGIVAFLAAVFFVQTLFVTPQLRVPFTLRQLKGQLKSLQKKNPAGQLPPNIPLWQKFIAARAAARKQPSPLRTTPAPAPRKFAGGEVRLGFYTNGDPYSYRSLEQHAGELTHVCPEWFALADGLGNLQIDADIRIPKLAAAKGLALMPLLTNQIGDTWEPEAVENLAHGPPERQEHFLAVLLSHLQSAKAAGVVIDWEQVDPAYEADITKLLNKMAERLHADGRQLWLCVQPGQDLDYIDFESVSENVDRFVALLFDETSDDDSPGPLASRQWFESWLNALLKDADPEQWIIALGSYGYDWTNGEHRAELISFPEAMSRANNAGVESGDGRAARSWLRFLLRGCRQGTLRLVPRCRQFSERAARGARSKGGRFCPLPARHGRPRDLGRNQSPAQNCSLTNRSRICSRRSRAPKRLPTSAKAKS